MNPAQTLELERRLAELVGQLDGLRGQVERVDRAMLWRYGEAVRGIEQVARWLAETEDGNRLPGSLYD